MGAVLAGVAVGSGAAVQRISGLGFSLVCAPFLILAEGPLEGVRLANVLAAALGCWMLGVCWRHARWKDAGMLLLPALVVGPIVGIVARRADPSVLGLVAGIACLVAVAVVASGVRVSALHGRGGAIVAGSVSAAMNVAAGIGGPPVALYGVNADWDPDELRGTLQAFFFGLNLVSIASLGLPRVGATSIGVGLASVAVGVVVGSLLAGHVPDRAVRSAVLVIAAVGALVAIATNL